jgi:hypothetical protein
LPFGLTSQDISARQPECSVKVADDAMQILGTNKTDALVLPESSGIPSAPFGDFVIGQFDYCCGTVDAGAPLTLPLDD